MQPSMFKCVHAVCYWFTHCVLDSYGGQEELGFVYCCVNNCGVVSGRFLLVRGAVRLLLDARLSCVVLAALQDTRDESIVRTFRVNTLAVAWTTKAFLPAMLERNSGQILAVSSVGTQIVEV